MRDIVRAYALAMERGLPGELYLIGSQQIYTMEECLKLLISLSKVEGITYVVDQQRVRPTELRMFIGQFDKFIELTGWKAEIPLKETMNSILNYWREFVAKNYY